jgi:hypothetical protein
MKNVFVVITLLIFSSQLFAQTETKARPTFMVKSVELSCCGARMAFRQKVLHIVTSYPPSDLLVKIVNSSGGTVSTIPITSTDFKTPCLNLVNGATYTITFVDSAGLVFPFAPITKVAPSCPEIVGPKSSDLNPKSLDPH